MIGLFQRLAVVLALALPSAVAAAQSPDEPSAPLVRAVHAHHTLWLRFQDGALARLDDGSATMTRDDTAPSYAIDLCRYRDTAVIATGDSHQITFYRRDPDRWTRLGSAPAVADERMIGLACQGDAPVLVTRTRLVMPHRPPVPVVGELPEGVRYVAFNTGDAILVGSNRGEWGGGLVRVALGSGAVTEIEGAGAPVQDIAAEPGRPGCQLVAVGLVHFFPSGHLSEVCGTTARRFFGAPYNEQGFHARRLARTGDFYPGIAFFGLAPDGGGLTAVAIDGLRHIDAHGVSEPRPLPDFEDRGGVRVAEASPDLLLVLTTINRQVSVGGAMPLAVVR